MDLLSDILKSAGLNRRILTQRAFHSSVSLGFPCSRSIGFHVVAQGTAWIHSSTLKAPIELGKGDIAFMARGCDHVISTEKKVAVKSVRQLGQETVDLDASRDARSMPKLVLVSGAYQFWNEPVHPLFRELPEWFVLRAAELEGFDNLTLALTLLSSEVSRPQIGTERIVQGLLDVLFAFIVRKTVEMKSLETSTWSHAAHDPQIRRALELLHSDCRRDWSLEELAQNVGLSRAGFAQKFKKAMGDTPVHYLTSLRVQRAMDLLSSTTETIEAVADAVGYKDAFSFSKVFKREIGIPPKEFRNRDRSERELPWRFSVDE